VLRLKLAPFTLAARRRAKALLSAPFRGRFGLLERLAPYPADELCTTSRASAAILSVTARRASRARDRERSRARRASPTVCLRPGARLGAGRRRQPIDRALALEGPGVAWASDEFGLEDSTGAPRCYLAPHGARAVA